MANKYLDLQGLTKYDKIYLLLREVKFDKYRTSLSRYFILSSFLPEKEQVKLI